MTSKFNYVAFADPEIEKSFEDLKSGKSKDAQLYKSIHQAISLLKQNPSRGIQIQRRLWPRSYVLEFNVPNLWKYNLGKGWRMIYTIKEDEVMVVAVILEWFNHKTYEKKFKY